MDTKKQQFRVKPLAAAVGLAMVVPCMIGTPWRQRLPTRR